MGSCRGACGSTCCSRCREHLCNYRDCDFGLPTMELYEKDYYCLSCIRIKTRCNAIKEFILSKGNLTESDREQFFTLMEDFDNGL